MPRSLAVVLARAVPSGLKQWVHGHRSLDRLSRRVFARLAGSGVRPISGGPLEGLKLEMSEHVSHAHLSGTYELPALRAVDGLVRPGDVCYDLGASIGYFTLLMARRARVVYAFEPAPHACAEIEKHIRANRFTNVEVVQRPVSDGERTVRFSLTDVAYGSSITREESHWPTKEYVSTSLDRFVRDGHPAPDFVKIDVEGEEGRVLSGAAELLSAGRTTFCIELHNREVAEQVLADLAEHGYRVEDLDRRPFRMPREVFAGELQIIALPVGRGA